MTWAEELKKIAEQANGDASMFCALVALRKTESGKPGKEFGVLSEVAKTYDAQLRVACNSIKMAIVRAIDKGIVVKDQYGFYTVDFLNDFSARWAPIGVVNDPNNLNANHARNLNKLFDDYRGRLFHNMMTMDA